MLDEPRVATYLYFCVCLRVHLGVGALDLKTLLEKKYKDERAWAPLWSVSCVCEIISEVNNAAEN